MVMFINVECNEISLCIPVVDVQEKVEDGSIGQANNTQVKQQNGIRYVIEISDAKVRFSSVLQQLLKNQELNQRVPWLN